MGSRTMHYCISQLIGTRLGIEPLDEFMLGGIAPDIHPLCEMNKEITHFVDRDSEGRGRVNYMRFYEKYRGRMEQPFYLGYWCHLVSDSVWSEHTYHRKVIGWSKERIKQSLPVTYRDFWRLNGVIVEKYGLVRHPHSVPELAMEETRPEVYPLLLEKLAGDFAYRPEVAREPLEFLSCGEVDEFIRLSVDTCLGLIREKDLLPSRSGAI